MKDAFYLNLEALKEARYIGNLLGKIIITNAKVTAKLQEEADILKDINDLGILLGHAVIKNDKIIDKLQEEADKLKR